MKTIKILGTGCSNCKQMDKIVQAAVSQLNLNVNIEKVDDIQEIMTYNIMSTPALVINEKVVIKGRVPSLTEVKNILTSDDCCADSDNSCCSSDEHQTSSCCEIDSQNQSSECCSTETTSEKQSCCEPNSGCC